MADKTKRIPPSLGRLLKGDISQESSLPPAFKRAAIDYRANKYKKIGK